ncbi:hypothetical protein V8D89_011465, partial [Ganoderma adspersum]
MPSASELEARAARHRETREQSYALLDAVHAEAKQKQKYNSAEVRRTMTDMCLKKTGLTPYPEQLDLAECMLLGLDATCIAGTGWGKMLPFVLPLFVMPRKIIIIISPLNALEADQVRELQTEIEAKMGFRAIAINRTTYNPDVEKAVRLGSYSIILVGLNMCVDTQCSFWDVLGSPEFGKRILGMHVDEAHCIVQWGGKFRPEYSQLEAVHALFPCQVPVQITSATMPPHVLKLAQDTMNISPSQSFHLNLRNDRHNITWKVRYMKAGHPELDELDFLLPTSPDALSLTRMMVFFDDISLSMKAHHWFKAHLPDRLYLRVRCFNARRGEQSKKLVLQEFQDGKIDILLATEAAGMVS